MSSTTTSVGTIGDFLRELREKTKGMPASEAFGVLTDLLGGDIRLRYEAFPDPESTPEDGADPSPVGAGRFDHLDASKVGRVLLSTNRAKADFSRGVVRACNGVVLEYPGWRVLSYPPPMFRPSYRKADVAANMAAYKVYPVRDGTTMTLYHHDGEWRLSSANGFDVGSYRWTSDKTYLAALKEVLAQYPGFSFDALNPARCYTIGFRHSDFHPLKRDPNAAWLVQSCDLAAFAGEEPHACVRVDESIGLPVQTPLVFGAGLTGSALLEHLLDENKRASGRYFSSAEGPVHYGYVLRAESLPAGAEANSNLILESGLFSDIRYLMYNQPKQRYNNAVRITVGNRLDYTALRAYLSYSSRFKFIQLFPQFRDRYDRYDEFFKQLQQRIVGGLRTRNPRREERHHDGARTLSKEATKIEKLAVAMINNMQACNRINAMDPNGPSMVQDFILDKKYLDIYFTSLFASE